MAMTVHAPLGFLIRNPYGARQERICIRRELNPLYSLRPNAHIKQNSEKSRCEHRCSRDPGHRRTRLACRAASVDVSVLTDVDFSREIARLRGLEAELASCQTTEDRIASLLRQPLVAQWAATAAGEAVLRSAEAVLSPSALYAILCLPAIGQGHVLSVIPDDVAEEDTNRPAQRSARASSAGSIQESTYSVDWEDTESRGEQEADALGRALRRLSGVLVRVERFYDGIGGIVGYQRKALELIAGEAGEGGDTAVETRLHRPAGPDLSDTCEGGPEMRRMWATEGLMVLPNMAEIYPVGGAGDRLGLVDEETGESLPTAVLPYCGRSLLEGLVRDLQGREYLHWRLTGGQETTPVVVMTSQAKGNHSRIVQLFESCGWMGRGEDAFMLIEQPMVPVVSAEDGAWLLESPLAPMLKPGGHGALWKLMRDEGAFGWLESKGRRAAIVRQISNPMAGTDATLLALSGAGCLGKKAFGFASCERAVGAAEGINVLLEKRNADGSWEYGVSNVEYTEFDRIGFSDAADETSPSTSRFPANTNILYVDLSAVQGALRAVPESALPGMIFNRKKKVSFRDAADGGRQKSVKAGRIESTMQNLADHLVERFGGPLSPDAFGGLHTFVVYNERRRTTSSAKRQRKAGDKHLHQTPDGSFLDLMRNGRDLLIRAGWEVPDVGAEEDYLARGPSMVFLFHPGLGPLWDVAAQKLGSGVLREGSEMVVECAEVRFDRLEVDGSLRVEASAPLGRMEEGELRYSDECGRIRMEGCRVINQGIDRDDPGNVFWRQRVSRKEGMLVLLEGQSEFEAHDVTFQGSHTFLVPHGTRMVVLPYADSPDGFRVVREPIGDRPGWRWQYRLEEGGRLELTLN